MAAVPLSNHSLSFHPRISSSFTKPSNILAFPNKIQLNQCLCKSKLGFSVSTTSPISPLRRSFISKSKPIDGEVVTLTPNLKTLMLLYKEAILDLDEETVSEIEALICKIEKEKNVLTKKVATLSANIASGKENYIHLQADFENFRKRFEKDRVRLTSNTQVDLIESLLPLVDSFERAKQQCRPETEKEEKLVTSYQGIYKQFVETMRSLRVAVIGTVGKPFDPSLHEAIAREESQLFREGIIVQEVLRGFLLGDRVVRPAKVKVSSGPGRHKPTSTTEESISQSTVSAGLDESSDR
ncbi:hypothetical protein MKW94_028643 [Papaver nudicaule]|uniref:GrpE protein homolog n=1 Tax=Papaver nudicaule TaxID=74823 RepID=A0AA41S5H7_PAPNU|nr:hypothetical protein [Papaver nudicaule]